MAHGNPGLDEATRLSQPMAARRADDGSPDLNRHMAKNPPYANWYTKIERRRPGGS
jgi:hypothetical protein